jgi:hypothetical protein
MKACVSFFWNRCWIVCVRFWRWHPTWRLVVGIVELFCFSTAGSSLGRARRLVEEDAGEGGHGQRQQRRHGAHAWRRVAKVLLAGAHLLATAESGPLVAPTHVVGRVVAA